MAVAIGLLSIALLAVQPLRRAMGLALPGEIALPSLALLAAAGWVWLRLPGVRADD
jgi:hypothetical protein